MRTRAVLLIVVGLLWARVGSATPLSSCTNPGGLLHCDVYESDSGETVLGLPQDVNAGYVIMLGWPQVAFGLIGGALSRRYKITITHRQ